MTPLASNLASALAPAQTVFNDHSKRLVFFGFGRAESVTIKSGQFRVALPIEATIDYCKGELRNADFGVAQVGERRLLACKKNTPSDFIELNMEAADERNTDVKWSRASRQSCQLTGRVNDRPEAPSDWLHQSTAVSQGFLSPESLVTIHFEYDSR